MYDIYAHIARLNAEALRRCEKDFLDPDHDENDLDTEYEEGDNDDTC